MASRKSNCSPMKKVNDAVKEIKRLTNIMTFEVLKRLKQDLKVVVKRLDGNDCNEEKTVSRIMCHNISNSAITDHSSKSQFKNFLSRHSCESLNKSFIPRMFQSKDLPPRLLSRRKSIKLLSDVSFDDNDPRKYDSTKNKKTEVYKPLAMSLMYESSNNVRNVKNSKSERKKFVCPNCEPPLSICVNCNTTKFSMSEAEKNLACPYCKSEKIICSSCKSAKFVCPICTKSGNSYKKNEEVLPILENNTQQETCETCGTKVIVKICLDCGIRAVVKICSKCELKPSESCIVHAKKDYVNQRRYLSESINGVGDSKRQIEKKRNYNITNKSVTLTPSCPCRSCRNIFKKNETKLNAKHKSKKQIKTKDKIFKYLNTKQPVKLCCCKLSISNPEETNTVVGSYPKVESYVYTSAKYKNTKRCSMCRSKFTPIKKDRVFCSKCKPIHDAVDSLLLNPEWSEVRNQLESNEMNCKDIDQNNLNDQLLHNCTKEISKSIASIKKCKEHLARLKQIKQIVCEKTIDPQTKFKEDNLNYTDADLSDEELIMLKKKSLKEISRVLNKELIRIGHKMKEKKTITTADRCSDLRKCCECDDNSEKNSSQSEKEKKKTVLGNKVNDIPSKNKFYLKNKAVPSYAIKLKENKDKSGKGIANTDTLFKVKTAKEKNSKERVGKKILKKAKL